MMLTAKGKTQGRCREGQTLRWLRLPGEARAHNTSGWATSVTYNPPAKGTDTTSLFYPLGW